MPDVQRLHVLQRKTKYVTAYSYHCGDFFIILAQVLSLIQEICFKEQCKQNILGHLWNHEIIRRPQNKLDKAFSQRHE
jgi:hypothetical protein